MHLTQAALNAAQAYEEELGREIRQFFLSAPDALEFQAKTLREDFEEQRISFQEAEELLAELETERNRSWGMRR